MVCRLCQVTMVDCEPMGRFPEYNHPRGTACKLGKLGHVIRPEDWIPWRRKRDRRARKRGARSASKYRPGR